jgi:hypothetical protein
MTEHNQMRGGFWSIRGLNKVGRLKCLADFINQNSLDFIGVQETKKTTIENSVFQTVRRHMDWNYVPAK